MISKNNNSPEILISIVITTFERPDYLSRAISSIDNQNTNFDNVEVIVVNDGSTEKYPAISCRFPLRVLNLNSNSGPAYARNHGVCEAQGEWVLFLDDDDELHPNYLQLIAEKSTVAIDTKLFWSNVLVLKKDGGKIIFFENSFTDDQLAHRLFLEIGASYGLCINTNYFTKMNGFNTAYRVAEDTDFFVRVLSSGEKIEHLNTIGVIKDELSSSRLTSSFKSYSDNRVYENIINSNFQYFSSKPYVMISLLNWTLKVHHYSENYVFANEIFVILSNYNISERDLIGSLSGVELNLHPSDYTSNSIKAVKIDI